jgi:hypothetical protein
MQLDYGRSIRIKPDWLASTAQNCVLVLCVARFTFYYLSRCVREAGLSCVGSISQ